MSPNSSVKPIRTKKQTAKIIAAYIIAFLANAILFFMIWVLGKYDNVRFDQILYQGITPMTGTSDTLVISAMLRIFGLGALAYIMEIIVYFFLSGRFADKLSRFSWYTRYSATRVAHFFKNHFMSLSALLLLIFFCTTVFTLGIHTFLFNQLSQTSFFEENYTDPETVSITFPEEKRNLIVIYLESMEATFLDTGASENITDTLIPELRDLRDENISFSGKDGISGAYAYEGTAWTAAALVAQSAGITVKVPLSFKPFVRDGEYMPGLTSLGDILEAEGYNQSIVVGSYAEFAARDAYFKTHGSHKIIDLVSLIDDGTLPEDYRVWWGFEDLKLFEESKKELTRLASLGEPFAFTTLTADTHFPDGYLCPECPTDSENQYANVLACSSRQVYEFLEWCKAQDFYENTTIVITGDHLTMDPNFLSDMDGDYVRTTYNCIINSPVEPVLETGREFSTLDMFPTTLAAMGVSIEGDRLGLGTNLFSGEQTLTEIYGREELQRKLARTSKYYFDEFFEEN